MDPLILSSDKGNEKFASEIIGIEKNIMKLDWYYLAVKQYTSFFFRILHFYLRILSAFQYCFAIKANIVKILSK